MGRAAVLSKTQWPGGASPAPTMIERLAADVNCFLGVVMGAGKRPVAQK